MQRIELPPSTRPVVRSEWTHDRQADQRRHDEAGVDAAHALRQVVPQSGGTLPAPRDQGTAGHRKERGDRQLARRRRVFRERDERFESLNPERIRVRINHKIGEKQPHDVKVVFDRSPVRARRQAVEQDWIWKLRSSLTELTCNPAARRWGEQKVSQASSRTHCVTSIESPGGHYGIWLARLTDPREARMQKPGPVSRGSSRTRVSGEMTRRFGEPGPDELETAMALGFRETFGCLVQRPAGSRFEVRLRGLRATVEIEDDG